MTSPLIPLASNDLGTAVGGQREFVRPALLSAYDNTVVRCKVKTILNILFRKRGQHAIDFGLEDAGSLSNKLNRRVSKLLVIGIGLDELAVFASDGIQLAL